MPVIKKRLPVKYHSGLIPKAAKLSELGATEQEVADILGVHLSTVKRWCHEHQDFCKALKMGREAPDDRVERSLYSRATGYSYETEKVFCHEGKIMRATVTEHVPPDTTACIFWLKNRRPAEWRDRKELSGDSNGANATPFNRALSALDRLIEQTIAERTRGNGARVVQNGPLFLTEISSEAARSGAPVAVRSLPGSGGGTE